MTIAITQSRASIGIQAPAVTVEAHITGGSPRFNIVGLPETVVKESKDRVRSAIMNCNFEFPNRHITVNLAPAELPKYGGRYDLAIAIGILAASGQLPKEELSDYEFAGELALSGEVRPIPGVLPFALATRKSNRILVLPTENAPEAAIIEEILILPTSHLLEICGHFLNNRQIAFYAGSILKKSFPLRHDLKDVKGQHQAKRALEIVAAGRHSLLLIGPPGVGKTLISQCLPGILPPMSEEEAIELATIHSVSGKKLVPSSWLERPFRSPHHSASSYALIGGGNPPKPGEISLAHHGVLFLDELPEYKRQALECLREPLESGAITISRAKTQIEYPAKFQLVATMNPCPCGYYGDLTAECRCSLDQVKKYQGRISGPLMDRIDIQAELQPLPSLLLTKNDNYEESSHSVATRVLEARSRQLQRAGRFNGQLEHAEIKSFCALNSEDAHFLEAILKEKRISVRSYHKVLKIARTIADLENEHQIKRQHLKEAIFYRHLERMKNK